METVMLVYIYVSQRRIVFFEQNFISSCLQILFPPAYKYTGRGITRMN